MATDPSKYLFNHTMLRCKDPKASMRFYERLGMHKIHQMDYSEDRFSLYFLAFDSPQSVWEDQHWTARQGVLELTHNHGTEDDPSFKAANGNEDPGRGFGHVCIAVDNIQASCQRLEDAGVKFQKKLSDGRMRHIAFALDPDGYWVELIAHNSVEESAGVKTTDPALYRFNHTMLRVKDQDKSLRFYQDVMGMQIIRTNENPDHKFNLYFLAYKPDREASPSTQSQREGLLELTWNYGTESDPDFKYHHGNSDPQGFGHICVSVDDLEAACQRLEQKGVQWKKRLTDGRMKDVAFVLDPDGYWIEIIQNQALKKTNDW